MRAIKRAIFIAAVGATAHIFLANALATEFHLTYERHGQREQFHGKGKADSFVLEKQIGSAKVGARQLSVSKYYQTMSLLEEIFKPKWKQATCDRSFRLEVKTDDSVKSVGGCNSSPSVQFETYYFRLNRLLYGK